MEATAKKTLKHNVIVNLLDGGFFGFGLGFSSFVTIIPLFVSTLTDSAILIGLIPAIHNMGWQFPQLLIANRVAKKTRYKPMVLLMTIHERTPFLGLVIIGLSMGFLGHKAALYMTFVMLIWQGLGSGFTANAWQSLIAKIIPANNRGTFFGFQASAANFLASISAILAGLILDRFAYPINFTICFSLTCISMLISFFFLVQIKEDEKFISPELQIGRNFWKNVQQIIKNEKNFRWFLIVRILSQIAIMAFAFYTVYAVKQLGMSEIGVGFMTSVYTGSQIIANPIMGYFGDRYGHRLMMQIGIASAVASSIIAAFATSPSWFYLIFLLAGIANIAVWNTALSMTIEFGEDHEKPFYIGLANTFVAPMTMLAPIIGGWIADTYSYSFTFIVAAVGGIITMISLQGMQNPKVVEIQPTPD